MVWMWGEDVCLLHMIALVWTAVLMTVYYTTFPTAARFHSCMCLSGLDGYRILDATNL